MYKEVAIDPACMADFEYYILLKREFGFEKGRYAAADVKLWAQAAYQFLKKSDIQPVKQKSVSSFLNRVQRGREPETFLLTAHRKAVQDKSSWNAWWTKQNNYRPFSVSVSKDVRGCINHETILDGCREWDIPPSTSVMRSAPDIVNAVEPLIQLSKHLLLVDQFFEFSGNDILQELTKILNGSSITKLTIVTSTEPPRGDNLQRIFESQYHSFRGSRISLKWIKAPKIFFHDRYFITDIGAVSVGHGFLTSTPQNVHSDRVELSLKSISETQRVKQDLQKILESGVASVILDIHRA